MKTALAMKVMIVLTSHAQLGDTGKKTGWYLPEASHPYFALTQSGYEVDFVSPVGGKAPLDQNSRDLSDADNARFLANPLLVKQVENTLKPRDIDPKKYAAILFAGGHGTMWDFADNQELARLAAQIYEQGGVVAAVCHGPAGIVNIKLSNGEYLLGEKLLLLLQTPRKPKWALLRLCLFYWKQHCVRGALGFKLHLTGPKT
ncbi:MAG: type 1 glutamine amidotransferase domain-containing protein [Bdellovibrionota bacterium]